MDRVIFKSFILGRSFLMGIRDTLLMSIKKALKEFVSLKIAIA